MSTKLAIFLLLLSSFATGQMAQQAQIAAQRPAKIDVTPVSAQNAVGQPVPVEVQLLDAAGKPIAAREPVNAEVLVKQPSGQTQVTKVTLSPGESSKQVDLNIPEAGVTELQVRQSENKLIGATNYTLLIPPEKQSAHKRSSKKSQKKTTGTKKPISQDLAFPRSHPGRPRLILASYQPDPPETTPAPSHDLMLKVSGEDAGGGVQADGKTCARVHLFYTGTKDLERDVQVWLTWSDGNISPDQPVIVSKQTRTGEACWTSKFPKAAATIGIVATNPHIPFSTSDRQTIKFSENIQGIGFLNPPRVITITIVDNYNLTAAFFDPLGHPVKLIAPRDLLFGSNNGVIHVTPQHATVPGGKFDSSTVLIPTYFGTSSIQVSADNYPSDVREVRVTWLTALLGSLLGGFLGGLLAFVNSGGKFWARAVTGLIVGFFASWAYVVVGLPKVESGILHNQLSVTFVSLAAGFVGVKAISVITGKLNFGF